MPIDSHLNWVDQTDFTAGLWDISSPSQLLSAQQAFSVLTDYEPQAEGGLRAYFQGTTLANTGIGSDDTQIPMGIFAVTYATDDDRYIATINPANGRAHLYRWNAGGADTQWGNIWDDGSDDATISFEYSEFATFKLSADDTVWHLWQKRGGNNQGVYKVSSAAGTTTKIYGYNGPILVSQARLIMGDGSKLRYTDLGKLTQTSSSAQVLDISPNEPNSTIGILSERAPADLLAGLYGSPWIEINGAISSSTTPVRAMGDDHHQRAHFQHPCRVPGGVAFIEPGGRIYHTDGQNFTSLSDSIARFAVDAGSGQGPGQLACLNDYLFAPGGRVYDFRTKAWFKSSFMPTSVFHAGLGVGKVYMCNGSGGILAGYMRLMDGSDSNILRMNSATAQTVPYADEKGRNVRIREFQLFLKNYAASSYTVSIIGAHEQVLSSQTISAVKAGRTMVKFQFPNVQDDYLSVKVTASADDGTSEAPTIERWRIGFGQNNLIGNVAT